MSGLTTVAAVDGGHEARRPQDPPTTAVARFTDESAGDLAPPPPGEPGEAEDPPRLTPDRGEAVAGRPVTWVRQVHGADVITVDDELTGSGLPADGLVTDIVGRGLAIFTADCAPIALLSAEGPVGAVHAGWRGLEAGVVEHTVARLRHLGADDIAAVVGPCIGVECYEFGAAELARLVDHFGRTVEGQSAAGLPALDVRAAATVALHRAGVAADGVHHVDVCTACSPRHWSHRATGAPERHAMLVWREPAGADGSPPSPAGR